MQTLSDTIAQTIEKFIADPESAVARPSVTATLINGRARVSSGPFNWEADLGPAIGGQNLAPSPTAYLLGALAACGVVFLRDTLGPQFGVQVDDVTATVSCRADAAGLLGIDGTDPALSELTLTIIVSSPDPRERVEAMFAAWRERCPIYLALLRPNEVRVDLAGRPTS